MKETLTIALRREEEDGSFGSNEVQEIPLEEAIEIISFAVFDKARYATIGNTDETTEIAKLVLDRLLSRSKGEGEEVDTI